MDECWLSLTVPTAVTLRGTAQSLMKLEIRPDSFRNGIKVITSNVEKRKKMSMTLMAGLAFAVDEGQTKIKVNSDMNQRSA